MSTEEKQLLLADLSARLPYSTLCYCKWVKDAPNGTSGCIQEVSTYLLDELMIIGDQNYECQICEIKPYLRPMSSMTEEEEIEFEKIFELELKALESPEGHTIESAASSVFAIDFYNKYHFDCRGLIEKGLAIAVTEENNPYKR